MRDYLVAGNWKMNGSGAANAGLVRGILDGWKPSDSVRLLVCPPYPYLGEVQGLIARLTGARGIYTVQNADSLSKIAAFFYHDGLRWPAIFKANSHLIHHPDLSYPEQVLIVPH